jgi:hypothetical protein
VDKSYIRSILWDNWTENQLEFMKQGGNKNLKDFLLEYPHDIKQITPEKFYNSKILVYYRKLLKSKVNKTQFDILPPSKEEAFEPNEVININKDNFSSYGSVGQINSDKNNNKDDNYGDNKSTLQEGLDTVKNFMGKAFEGTKNAVENFNLGNKLTNAKNFLFDTGNKILENKQISSFLNFFKANNKEEPIENQ